MGLLFDRIVRVTFGKPGTEGTRVSGLYVQFDIEKTSESNPNKGSIQIFNLNPTSIGVLQQKGNIVRLEAGYAQVPEELFLGDVSKASSAKQGPNIITTIEVGDSRKKFQEKRINITLGPGATEKQAVESLARAFEVGVGAIKGVTEKIFQQGITLEGPVKDKLDEVIGKMGLEWSIQDGALQILPPDTPSETLGILLTPETGLIEAPAKREKGIEFKALLRVALKPGVSVEIRSRFISGFFKIRKAKYIGDNRGGSFEVNCEAVEVESGAQLTSEATTLNVPTLAVEGFA